MKVPASDLGLYEWDGRTIKAHRALNSIRAVALPPGLFADIAPKVLLGWRARVAAEAPSHLREHPHEIKMTMLAAYLRCREREELRELMYRSDKARKSRILRSVYECGVFQALREKLRCKEIWVTGAEKWRNPDEDLPKDFEANRAENYAKLRKPLDARRFTAI